MAVGTCDQCQKESTFLDMYAGMRLKCKVCQTGFVTLPPKAGAVYAKPEPVAPIPAPPPPVIAKVEPKETYVPRPAISERLPTPQEEALLEKIHAEYETHDRGFAGIYYVITFNFIVLGVGSVFLNTLGFHFTIIACLDPVQPVAGVVMAMIGAGMLVYRWTRSR